MLAYRLYMEDSLQQVLVQNYITGAPQPFVAETVLEQEHLLPLHCIAHHHRGRPGLRDRKRQNVAFTV